MQKNNSQINDMPSMAKAQSSSSVELTIPSLMENLSLCQNKQVDLRNQKQLIDKGRYLRNISSENQGNLFGRKQKNKRIEKPRIKPNILKRSYKKRNQNNRKMNYKKKFNELGQKTNQLEQQISRLKSKMQCCPQCRYYVHKKQNSEGILNKTINDNLESYNPNYEQQMKKIAGGLNQSKGSMGSLEFQKVDFQVPMMFAKQLDDKAWVYIGTLMIAMGSKCIQVDGTINSVDTLRRQVQKSKPEVCLDFYITQQQMKLGDNAGMMQEIGFDPFAEKIGGDTGLALEGIKIESVEQFQLIYDNKLTYNIKYEALLGAMEYIRQNSWLTF